MINDEKLKQKFLEVSKYAQSLDATNEDATKVNLWNKSAVGSHEVRGKN